MVVAFDNNVLCLLLHPEADIPNDPATGQPIDRAQERMELLVAQLTKDDARIVIPAPVLSEFLTFASSEYLDEIHASKHFAVGAFDERAAIEAAIALKRAFKSGKGKKLGLTSEWQKIKIDRQVVAIAKVEGAEVIYTTDKDILLLAEESALRAVHAADLPLPPSKTPLLDATVQDQVSGATASPQLSEQSPAAEKPKDVAPEPARPSTLRAAPKPPQPDSSRPAAQPSQSAESPAEPRQKPPG